MTLLDFPLELFRDVVSYLPLADKHCLRITCSGFRKLIPFDWGAPLRSLRLRNFHHLPSHATLQEITEQRLEFLHRCFAAQNNTFKTLATAVYYCGVCLRVRPRNRFPMDSFRSNYRRACDNCIVQYFNDHQPPGSVIGYGETAWYACQNCGTIKTGEETHHEHDSRMGRALCEACHMVRCTSPSCEAWPEGFVEENKDHFR